jgi:hypothetical protein
MSGPKSARYNIHARREAEEARVREERARRQEQLAALVHRCTETEARIEQLAVTLNDLRRKFPTESLDVTMPPAIRPQTADLDKLSEYVNRLEKWASSTALQLSEATAQAVGNKAFREAANAAQGGVRAKRKTAEEVLDELTHNVATHANHKDVKQQQVLQRLLSRLPSDKPMPPPIAQLAAQYLAARTPAEAEPIGIELRLQVQQFNDSKKRQERDHKEAVALLSRLGPSLSPRLQALERELELVQAGFNGLTADLRDRAKKAVVEAAAELTRAEQAAAAEILARSLGDLGYEVAPIENTLFVQGGTAYFKKPGWDRYCVRMVVRPVDEAINFNVVRMPDKDGNTPADSRHADAEIENEWCGSLHQLGNVLESRGIDLKMTREIPAGVLPVPVVKPDDVSALFGKSRERTGIRKTQASSAHRTKQR